jgi:hypothetical protein
LGGKGNLLASSSLPTTTSPPIAPPLCFFHKNRFFGPRDPRILLQFSFFLTGVEEEEEEEEDEKDEEEKV